MGNFVFLKTEVGPRLCQGRATSLGPGDGLVHEVPDVHRLPHGRRKEAGEAGL